MEKVENYVRLNGKYLREGDVLLKKGNFYENWLTAEMVVDHSKAVKSLVEKLKRLAR